MPNRMTSTGPTLGTPECFGDWLNRDSLLPGGAKLVAAEFPATDAVKVTLTANAALAAVSLVVTALTGVIPSGTLLYFAAGKYARTTAANAVGATSLAVEALPVALVSGDTATYGGLLSRSVPAGTAVGRTIAERDAGTGFGLAAAADDEIFLTALDVTDASLVNDVELYRHGRVVKENFLPGFSTLAAGVVTKLRDKYIMTRGAE